MIYFNDNLEESEEVKDNLYSLLADILSEGESKDECDLS